MCVLSNIVCLTKTIFYYVMVFFFAFSMILYPCFSCHFFCLYCNFLVIVNVRSYCTAVIFIVVVVVFVFVDIIITVAIVSWSASRTRNVQTVVICFRNMSRYTNVCTHIHLVDRKFDDGSRSTR